MIILTIRTDKPEAEIGLYDNTKKLGYYTWLAHRQLSQSIHGKIKELLQKSRKDWHDIEGVVCFQGPGSFTGLRIGLTVANSLAANLGVPVLNTNGKNWTEEGITKLLNGKHDKIVLPKYGRLPHITKPKR